MNGPRLEETGRGLTVHAGNRYLYSKYQPEKRSIQAAESAPIKNRCLYFVPSPLLGYGLACLVNRIPEDSIIIAIEESQELMALCSPEIQEELISEPRIIQVRLSDIDSLHALLYQVGPWRFRRVQRVDLNSGPTLNASLYDELASFLIEDLMTYWRNRHALGRLGREWIRHITANLSAMVHGNTSFRSVADLEIPGIPIVVGAGPSLENALPFIRQSRSKLSVLATDTAVPALISAGIQPDAIVVLETQAWNLLDFHGTKDSGIDVITDLTSYPPSLTFTGGQCYMYSSNFAELEFLKRLDEFGLREYSIPPLGSVGLAALEIAMGRNDGPVFLTGLDFAYSPGKSHARGTSFHLWQLSGTHRLNPHPGWESSIKRPRLKSPGAAGEMLNTDSILQGYAALLKDRFSDSGRVYVIEPGGLNLGLPVISLSEAEEMLRAAERNGAGSAPHNLKSAVITRKTGNSAISAADFLETECQRLDAVIETWDDYVMQLKSASDVKAALEGMDEIFSDFPDEPPLPKTDDTFLVRAVSRARQLRSYIDRVQNLP
jgi:hypothetical protein